MSLRKVKLSGVKPFDYGFGGNIKAQMADVGRTVGSKTIGLTIQTVRPGCFSSRRHKHVFQEEILSLRDWEPMCRLTRAPEANGQKTDGSAEPEPNPISQAATTVTGTKNEQGDCSSPEQRASSRFQDRHQRYLDPTLLVPSVSNPGAPTPWS